MDYIYAKLGLVRVKKVLLHNWTPKGTHQTTTLTSHIIMIVNVNDPDTAKNHLQTDLNNIQQWADSWLVDFSPAKSKDLVMTLKTNKPIHQPVTLDGTVITRVEEHKHLGISLSSDLRWTTHVMAWLKKPVGDLMS